MTPEIKAALKIMARFKPHFDGTAQEDSDARHEMTKAIAEAIKPALSQPPGEAAEQREALAKLLCQGRGCDPNYLVRGTEFSADGKKANGDAAYFYWREWLEEADRILAAGFTLHAAERDARVRELEAVIEAIKNAPRERCSGYLRCCDNFVRAGYIDSALGGSK